MCFQYCLLAQLPSVVIQMLKDLKGMNMKAQSFKIDLIFKTMLYLAKKLLSRKKGVILM